MNDITFYFHPCYDFGRGVPFFLRRIHGFERKKPNLIRDGL